MLKIHEENIDNFQATGHDFQDLRNSIGKLCGSQWPEESRYDETHPSFLEGAEEKHVWTVKALEERLPNIDLILDLTATDRYYQNKA